MLLTQGVLLQNFELILRENIPSNFYQEALVMFFFFNVTSKDRSLKM